MDSSVESNVESRVHCRFDATLICIPPFPHSILHTTHTRRCTPHSNPHFLSSCSAGDHFVGVPQFSLNCVNIILNNRANIFCSNGSLSDGSSGHHLQVERVEPYDFSTDPYLADFVAANEHNGIVVVENGLHSHR